MNIQLPVFAGFTNYAICRSDDPRMTSCYVVDTGFKTISDYLVSDGTYACLPFVPGHLYFMYRGNGKKVDQVKSFQREVDLRAHLLEYYGTPWISGGQIVDWSLVFSMVSGHYCEAQARVRQGSARDGSQGERPQSLNPCLELTLKLVATHHQTFI